MRNELERLRHGSLEIDNSPHTLQYIWILPMPELKLPLLSIGLAQVIGTRRYRIDYDDGLCHIAPYLKRLTVFVPSHCMHKVFIYWNWRMHVFYTSGYMWIYTWLFTETFSLFHTLRFRFVAIMTCYLHDRIKAAILALCDVILECTNCR